MRHGIPKPSILFAAALALSACGLAPSAADRKDVAIEALDEQGHKLKAQFNADRGKVRLLFIIDPNCATCLRGLADIDRDLLGKLPANAAAYMVHLPVVGGTPKHVPGAAGLVNEAELRHYWDAKGGVGKQFTKLLSLRSKGEPALAWDVCFAFGPDATWGDAPPRPDVAMHQLSPLDPNPNIHRLDSKAFAQQVNQLLARPWTPAEQG